MARLSCPYDGCTSTFSRPSRLRIHIQRHQGIKEFQCTECKRGYHRRQHLQRHVAEVHQNQHRTERPLRCDHCDRQFKTAWGLRRHQVRIKKQESEHQRVRQHPCEICKARFFNIDDLERHSLRHDRFKCDIPSCPLKERLFKWTFYRHHMADYHSEPFTCEHCDQQFVRKSQIRSHVKQHMPRFTCTQSGCNKTFTSANSMEIHVQVGHGERLLKCSVVGCDWEFKYKYCLNRHLKIHQQNGKIVPMANRLKKKEPKFVMARKLAGLCLKL